MKTHTQLANAKEGIGKKRNLKLTQLGRRISARVTRAKNALNTIEITDEYFFGYTDIHLKKSNREHFITDSDDLEVRYGLL